MKLHLHAAASPATPYADRVQSDLNLAGARAAHAEISHWSGYEPTPLHDLTSWGREAGIGRVWYKNEGKRFGLGSFKALGGAYAIERELARNTRPDCGPHTFACATDGNHGRSVAWGASRCNASSVIYLPAAVSPGREHAIRELGARVVRTAGSYDEAVRQVDDDARREGWTVISDTAYPGYVSIPIDIMHGYAVTIAEVLDQLEPGDRITHVLVQAGVGGLAAAVCMYLWENFGDQRPQFIVVEPESAACCLEAAKRGAPVSLRDVHGTVMACLAAGDVSLGAWEVLRHGTNAFLAIEDAHAERAMRTLAADDIGITAGESGAAGFAGLTALLDNAEARNTLGLGPQANVLVFGTEGATDPEIYERIVGKPPG